MAKFSIGDSVRVIKDNRWGRAGEVGKIVEVDSSIVPYKIVFTTADNEGDKHLWTSEGNLELVSTLEPLTNSNFSIMKTLSVWFKKLTDGGVQTLRKAEYLNGDLELTAEGQQALMALVFDQNKDELVKLAQQKLDEAKEAA